MVVVGLLITAAGLLGLAWVRHTWLYFAVVSLVGVGTGLVLPCVNTLVTGAARTSERGLITALYGSVRFFGVAAGPPLFGLLIERSPATLFLLAGGGAGLVALLAGLFIRVGEIQKN
jgi:ACDE family multidrug resistance protein